MGFFPDRQRQSDPRQKDATFSRSNRAPTINRERVGEEQRAGAEPSSPQKAGINSRQGTNGALFSGGNGKEEREKVIIPGMLMGRGCRGSAGKRCLGEFVGL
ncbi:hypothetical protein JTE90_028434 [Oedothorax gibbosus]|uniref:Uncharacterized protein n=1 Tax=Oedothorax gibbosus TaxID=931172 RepID=A0AAV6VEP9_9ARAC|nr:hypothetical protein JTE90_028434 [Oedothorax gibbosus]